MSTCSRLLQPRPDTHVSISRAPAPACPSSPTSLFVNLHLPPWAGSWQAALAPLCVCSGGDAGRSNAQFPRMSPNCACLRLRKEAGVPPPSLSGSGPLHSPFPPTPIHRANPAIGFQAGGCLQRQSALRLCISAMGTKHRQERPTRHVPSWGTVGSRRWVALTPPSLLPTPQEEATSQQRSRARWPHRRMTLLAKQRMPC